MNYIEKYFAFNPWISFVILLFIVITIFFIRLSRLERLLSLIVYSYCFTEIVAISIATRHHFNLWFFNIMILPTYYLFALLYYNSLNNLLLKRSVIIMSTVFTILYLINAKFGQSNTGFNTYTYIPANIFVAFLAFMYLKQFVESRDENPFMDLTFWFSIATVIDLTGSIPIICTLSTFEFAETPVLRKIDFLKNILGYSWYIIIVIGIIWTKAKVKLRPSY